MWLSEDAPLIWGLVLILLIHKMGGRWETISELLPRFAGRVFALLESPQLKILCIICKFPTQ